MIEAVRDVAALERISRKISRLDETACNGVPDPNEDPRKGIMRWTEADAEANAAAVTRLMDRAREIAGAYGFEIRHQGDCRGVALYIVRANDSEWAV